MGELLFHFHTMSSHLDRRLKWSLITYYAIITIIVSAVVYELVVGSIGIFLAIICLASGFLIGVMSYRIFNFKRNSDERKVVGNMDRIGIIILISYTLFALVRYELIDYYFRGSVVIAITLSVYCGIML